MDGNDKHRNAAVDRHIGGLLITARRAKQMSADDLARRLNLTVMTYRAMESGKRRIDPQCLLQCARILGIDAISLFRTAAVEPQSIVRDGRHPVMIVSLADARERRPKANYKGD